jgi:hypothetical protein
MQSVVEFTSEQVDDLFIELHHGRELADAVRLEFARKEIK